MDDRMDMWHMFVFCVIQVMNETEEASGCFGGVVWGGMGQRVHI